VDTYIRIFRAFFNGDYYVQSELIVDMPVEYTANPLEFIRVYYPQWAFLQWELGPHEDWARA